MIVDRSRQRRAAAACIGAVPLLLCIVACSGPRAGAGAGAASDRAVAPTTATAAESVEPWTFDNDTGAILRTAHFRVYTTQLDPILTQRLPGFLEGALRHYRGAIPNAAGAPPLPPPPMKLDTFIMRNRAQWERLTKQLLAERAGPYLKIPRGGFAYGGRALLFDIGTHDTMAILAHEGWHQYVQRTFAQPIPIWLDEGLAAYMEGHRWGAPDARTGSAPVFLPWANTERFDALRDAESRGELLPLSRLLESAPGNLIGPGGDAREALTYYAQVWALAHFLVEGEGGKYRHELAALLSDAAEGRVTRRLGAVFGPEGTRILSLRQGPGVFLAYFNRDLAAAEREYLDFVNAVVRPGSRGPIVEGRSPLAVAPR
ncbi:MAG: DUF1570 domain-containing protein [Phycisphaeraceae bacterium]|nr:DUF1570 domain-containing protein [Phycisphaeraceae bacterium]